MICTAHFGSSKRECERYGMDHAQVEASLAGDDPLANTAPSRRWWDYLILILAVGVFAILAKDSTRVPFAMDFRWVIVMARAIKVEIHDHPQQWTLVNGTRHRRF